jgi:hypothetical protein
MDGPRMALDIFYSMNYIDVKSLSRIKAPATANGRAPASSAA